MTDRARLRAVSAAMGLLGFLLLAELAAALALYVTREPEAEPPRRWPPPQVVRPRDLDHPRPKEWFRYRIVCIGDSCTYGLGVPPERTYPALLERRLNRGESYQRYEVINLGVAGYTSYQGLRQLRELALEFHPDLVVASFGLNDKWRSEATDRRKDEWRRSALMTLRYRLADLLGHSHLFELLRQGLEPLLRVRRTRFANLAVEYRVPLEEYRRNLRAIAREVRASGAEVAFLSPAENPAIARLTEEGIAAYRRGRWSLAAEKLEELAAILGMYYPRPLYYLSLASEKLGRRARARKAMRRARQLAKVFPFPHPITVPLERIEVRDHLDGVELGPADHFDIYARYRDAMAEVAEEEGVPLVRVDEARLHPSDFTDYCHLAPEGYEKLVDQLLPVLLREILSRQRSGSEPLPLASERGP